MKCGDSIFNYFITPTKPISSEATKVTGLTKSQKKLFQHGLEVPTEPHKIVLKKMLELLTNLDKKCILIAHNCSFDSTRLIYAIEQEDLLKEFENVIFGFSDLLKLFKKILPKRKSYKLTNLITELLSVSCTGAHDASFDVAILKKLSKVYLTNDDIIKSNNTYNYVLQNFERNIIAMKLLPFFTPLKNVMSLALQKKVAGHGISCDLIVDTFKKKEEKETRKLLQKGIEGSETIIKSHKKLKDIIDCLKNL